MHMYNLCFQRQTYLVRHQCLSKRQRWLSYPHAEWLEQSQPLIHKSRYGTGGLLSMVGFIRSIFNSPHKALHRLQPLSTERLTKSNGQDSKKFTWSHIDSSPSSLRLSYATLVTKGNAQSDKLLTWSHIESSPSSLRLSYATLTKSNAQNNKRWRDPTLIHPLLV